MAGLILSPTGITTDSERRQAEQQADALNRINRQSNIFVRKYTDVLKKAAIIALRQGKKLELTDRVIDLVTTELIGLSVLAYFTGAKATQKQVKQLSLSSFDKDVSRIAKGFDINVGTLSKRLHKIVGPNVRENLHEAKRKINTALSELSAKQVPTKQATKILTSKLADMGLSPNSPAYVETLVRTHNQLAYNAAQHVELNKDNELWGYKYVTVGDDRVRPEHWRLDGLVRKKDDVIWDKIWPPNGWNCRCQPLAIYEPEPVSRLPKNITDLIDPAFRFNPGKELV